MKIRNLNPVSVQYGLPNWKKNGKNQCLYSTDLHSNFWKIYVCIGSQCLYSGDFWALEMKLMEQEPMTVQYGLLNSQHETSTAGASVCTVRTSELSAWEFYNRSQCLYSADFFNSANGKCVLRTSGCATYRFWDGTYLKSERGGDNVETSAVTFLFPNEWLVWFNTHWIVIEKLGLLPLFLHSFLVVMRFTVFPKRFSCVMTAIGGFLSSHGLRHSFPFTVTHRSVIYYLLRVLFTTKHCWYCSVSLSVS